ncbi:MAG: hypothetical protein ACI39F_02950 [Acutalibacteraceae bacterium]
MKKYFSAKNMMMEMCMCTCCMCMAFVCPYPICSPLSKKRICTA